MIRMMASAGVTIAATVGLMIWTSGSTSALPFYDSADLSPRWSRSVQHRIADFDLVAQDGGAIRRSDLLGRIHVATFIYTRCTAVCPAMVTQLSKVQRAIGDATDALLVSYSATPHLDTPASLKRFAAERGIDDARWKLVTGDPEQIYALARVSYFADDGRLDASRPANEQFLHTEKALLVDREGRIRGVYNATVPYDIEKLVGDIGILRRGE
jgi:protein SCO1/2